MDSFVEEKNSRQINIMKTEISNYQCGKTDIGRFIRNMKGLLWEMEDISARWRDDFLSEWGALEAAHALILNRQEESGNPASESDNTDISKFIIDAVKKLRLIVEYQPYQK